MKVCTDSCLFGAWTANWLSKNFNQTRHILDIGAGTGLLSLMLAQKLKNAKIDAIEINEEAALKANENFDASPWKNRLQIYQNRVQNFHSNIKYDVIICNPPFYENDLRSTDKTKNTAHHSTELSLPELIIAIKRLLNDDGHFTVLLPYHRSSEMETLALAARFFLQQKTSVKQTERHKYFRSMLHFSQQKAVCLEDEIAIKNSNDCYTETFVYLLKDYYLNL